MTHMDKSPEQLDAEAAAPPPDTTLSIARHRALYRAELRIPLTTSPGRRRSGSRVPSDLELVGECIVNEQGEWIACGYPRIGYLDAGELGGPSLSPQMVARLSEPPYGAGWQMAFFALRNECRTRHFDHTETKEWGGSLCWRLVYLVVIGAADGPMSLERACQVMGLEEERTEAALGVAFRFMDKNMAARIKADWERGQREARRAKLVGTTQAGEDPMPPPHDPHRLHGNGQHHAVPGVHERECENPECRKRRAA